jgi:hypothetical protein
MRQVFKKVHKMLGRDLTPQKIQARVPRVFWASTLTEWLLVQAAPSRLVAALRDYAYCRCSGFQSVRMCQ